MKYAKQYTLRDLKRLCAIFLSEKQGLSTARNFLTWLEKREWQKHVEHCEAYHIDPYTEEPVEGARG